MIRWFVRENSCLPEKKQIKMSLISMMRKNIFFLQNGKNEGFILCLYDVPLRML